MARQTNSASGESQPLLTRPLTWLLILLGLGLALRGYHYLRDPVIWHDEAALLINVADKTFAEHLGPLFFAEAAPPLFLWLEKCVSLTLGTSSFTLRLLPFLASCAALLLLGRLAWRVLSPWSAVGFMLLLACSDRLLWHTCEAKPYAVDVFVAALVLFLLVRNEPVRAQVDTAAFQRRLCFLLTTLSPFLVFLSFPACFVLGGAALALLPAAWRHRRLGSLLCYGLFALALVGSFLLLLCGPIAAQRVEQLEVCWQKFLPHWDRPRLLPAEIVQRLMEVGRYACEPIGNVLALLAVVGAVALWRVGKRRLVVALAAPMLFLLVAWLAGKYPAGALRLVVFAAPGVLLLAAASLPTAWGWLQRRHRFAPVLLILLLLIPLAQAGYRVVVPWDHDEANLAVALVRQNLQPGELVIGTGWEHTWYCRDLGDQYRTLVARPRDPAQPGPFRDGEPCGESCWLLLREDTDLTPSPVLVRSPTAQERDAVAHLGIGTRWEIVAQYSFRYVSVLHLRRREGG